MTTMRAVILLLLLLTIAVIHAWVVPRDVLQKGIVAASISAAIFASPLVSHASSSQFDGSYSDPKHANCLRLIQTDGNVAKISGTDGTPACPPDGSGKKWNLQGTIDGDAILVDFSPKGGPKNLVGKFDGTGIQWPDGNKWSLLPSDELSVW